MPTAQEVYTQTVSSLRPAERLRLAALILDDLTGAEVASVESSDFWSEQDTNDLTAFSLAYAESLYPEELQRTP